MCFRPSMRWLRPAKKYNWKKYNALLQFSTLLGKIPALLFSLGSQYWFTGKIKEMGAYICTHLFCGKANKTFNYSVSYV